MDVWAVLVAIATGACVAAAAWRLRTLAVWLVVRIEHRLRGPLGCLHLSRRTIRRGIVATGVLVPLVGLIVGQYFASFVWGSVAALVVAALIGLALRRAVRERRETIERQMADALGIFSSAIRAGLTLPQAIALLAEETPQPIRREFLQMHHEYQWGRAIDRLLIETRARLRSENFSLFAAALLASRDSGGKLNETVERIARSAVEQQRLQRKLLAETAQARKSAVYMTVVPVILLGVYALIDPESTRLLFVTLPGQLLLALAVLLSAGAYTWALRILGAEL